MPARDLARWISPGLLPLGVVAVAVLMARHGLDRTDEGYYLNAIRHPMDDLAPVSLFGYAYSPLFDITGGDIVWLRWLGIALSLAAGFGAAWVILGIRPVVRRGLRALDRGILSALIASVALYPLVGMPSTPNYNTLAMQGILVSAPGLALARFGEGWRASAGWGLLGLGGAVTFLGKPTAAAALVFALGALALLDFGRWLIRIPIAIASAAFVILLVTRQGPFALADQLGSGLEATRQMGGHGIRRMLGLYLPDLIPILTLAAVAVVVLTAIAMLALERGLFSLAAFSLIVALLTAGSSVWWVAETANESAMLAATPLIAVLGLIGLRQFTRSGHAIGSDTDRGRALYLIILIALPFAFALGTNNDFWAAAGRGSALWVLAVTVILAEQSTARALGPGLAANILLTSHLALTVLEPYRYPSLLDATTTAVVTPSGAQVRLTAADAARTDEFLQQSVALGIDEGSWILDLTGDAPGYVHHAGAHSVGRAWLLGGYPGSDEVAVRVLGLDPCRLRDAWLFYSPSSNRSLSPGVLEHFGLSLSDDYEVVGYFQRSASEWSSPAGIDLTQILQPRGELEIEGCSAP